MIIRFVLAAGILLAAPAPALAAPVGPDRALTRAVDAYLAPYVAAGHFGGQVVVSREGRILVDRAYGMAQRELAVPMTPETRINVASITKPMTVIILTRLVEEGRLTLADTLGTWIPGFPAGDTITVDHLLQHRAGIPHRVTDEKDESQLLDPAAIVELARGKPRLFAPGERSSYSSAGFTVLARVLELASGRTFGELVERYVFAPLGMTHSFHPDDRSIRTLRAPSYVPGLAGIENAPLKEMSFLAGAGSVFSTARDLDRFGRAIVDGTLGVGARLSWVRGGRMSLNGSSNGYRAFVEYDSTSGLLVSVTANVTTGAADRIRAEMPRLVAGDVVPAPSIPPAAADPVGRRARVSDAAMRRIEGVYMLGNGQRLDLAYKGGMMAANEWILVPTSDSTFFSLRDYGVVTAVAGADGTIERLDWEQGGRSFPAPRLVDTPAAP